MKKDAKLSLRETVLAYDEGAPSNNTQRNTL
jgi:hypothetical protein